jgi:hypothetical protein
MKRTEINKRLGKLLKGFDTNSAFEAGSPVFPLLLTQSLVNYTTHISKCQYFFQKKPALWRFFGGILPKGRG